MAVYDTYYSTEDVNDSIRLCFIDIDLFVQKYLNRESADSLRREKSVCFEPDGALASYFNKAEFNTINRFKILKKQVEWMTGKIAVKRLVSAASGLAEHQITISAKEGGAPFLSDFPEFSISITHSGRFAVAGLGLNKKTVAVDIEQIEENRMEAVGRVAFSEKEQQLLKGKNARTHYIFWTVKEAYLKYIGKGFAEGLKKVEFLDGGIFHHGIRVEGLTVSTKILEKGYAFTLIY